MSKFHKAAWAIAALAYAAAFAGYLMASAALFFVCLGFIIKGDTEDSP